MGCETNLTIQKGTTYRRVVTWAAGPIVYKAITAVPQLAPVRLTVVGHGIVDGWRVAISDVEGMRELNAAHEPPRLTEYWTATLVDVDTIEINELNAASYHAYTEGGFIRYYTPVDLTGYTARIDIRERAGGDILWNLSTTIGSIVIDVAAQTITFTITDEESADFEWRTGVYALEMESPGGEVTQLLAGTITALAEVTTTETP